MPAKLPVSRLTMARFAVLFLAMTAAEVTSPRRPKSSKSAAWTVGISRASGNANNGVFMNLSLFY